MGVLRRRQAARPLLAVGALTVVVAGAFQARTRLGLEWNVESLRGLVEGLGLWGPLGLVLLVAFRTPLLIPSQLILTAAGLCFGVPLGTCAGAAGLLLSGLFAFGVTRWLGADVLRARVPSGLQRTLAAGGSRGGAGIVALATAYPIGPVTLVHAAAALTRLGVAAFALAAGVGGLVRAATYAWFGSSLIEGRWLQAAIAGAVLAISLLPLAIPSVRAWLRRQFEAEPLSPQA